MIKVRIFLFVLVSIMFTELSGQEFSVNETIKDYELLSSNNDFLSAAKLSFKIGEYFIKKNQFEEAREYFSYSEVNAIKAKSIEIEARAIYKKGLAEKLLGESGKLSMAEEQQNYKNCIESFKRAHVLFSNIKKTGSIEDLNSLLYGGEALFIIGNYKESVSPLKTVLRYAQKNRNIRLILSSSDLLAKNFQQLDDKLNYEYYQSIFDSYYEFNASKDSLERAQDQLRISKDSLTRFQQKLTLSIDSLKRTQKSLKLIEVSLTKSKDSLTQSRKSLNIYEASLKKAHESLSNSKDSLTRSLQEIALLDSANSEQRTALEIKQAEIILKQNEIIEQHARISEKEQDIKKKVEDISQKDLEIKSKEKTINLIKGNLSEEEDKVRIMMGAVGIVAVLLLSLLLAYQYKRKTNKKLEAQNKQILKQKYLIEKRQQELKDEKARTDALLLNILPVPVADELRQNKKVVPRYYKMVTIMFTDFRGFTTIAAKMSPGEIVRELDACFIAFDQIIEKYEGLVKRKCIEKIKTIGDGYMCAAGVPIENESNPMDMVRVALAINDYMEKRKIEKIARNEPFFEIRIGVNTGAVVAGVVGKKKFAYDIWGDAVNLASRMESSGEVGRVNISGETYKYLKDLFFFTSRGKIMAKNKGEVDMYFVDGRVKYSESNKN